MRLTWLWKITVHVNLMIDSEDGSACGAEDA